ncbi:hypothetical protein WKG94_20135 [Pantoea agglomerans]|uniref:hypothetical protein n=1 Tax=Enterobacter agglomerans TaxID=549 RepID=UPI000E20D2F7|nr:hypothetical protein [Pantoea agglomerans]
MTYELFPSTPDTDNAPTDTSSSGYDIEGIMHQLMQQTGCSADEAGAAVMRQLQAKKASQALPDVPYSKLRNEAERKEYMKRIRQSVTQDAWIPPQMREVEEGDISVAQAQAQFAENMKKKGSASPMHSSQAAIDFFRSLKK